MSNVEKRILNDRRKALELIAEAKMVLQKQTIELLGVEVPKNLVVVDNYFNFEQDSKNIKPEEKNLLNERLLYLSAKVQESDSVEEKRKYLWILVQCYEGIIIEEYRKKRPIYTMDDITNIKMHIVAENSNPGKHAMPYGIVGFQSMVSRACFKELYDSQTITSVCDYGQKKFPTIYFVKKVKKDIEMILEKENMGSLADNANYILQNIDEFNEIAKKYTNKDSKKTILNFITCYLAEENHIDFYNENSGYSEYIMINDFTEKDELKYEMDEGYQLIKKAYQVLTRDEKEYLDIYLQLQDIKRSDMKAVEKNEVKKLLRTELKTISNKITIENKSYLSLIQIYKIILNKVLLEITELLEIPESLKNDFIKKMISYENVDDGLKFIKEVMQIEQSA